MTSEKQKLGPSEMNPIGWFLIVLFLIVVFILIFCAYNTRCKKRKTQPLIVDPCCKKAIAHALRIQNSPTNLSSIAITTYVPSVISFTTPGPTDFLEIPIDGQYNVSYSVEMYWFKEASVETRLLAVYPDKTPQDSVSGSQTYVKHRTGTVDNVTHYFQSYFPSGTKLYLQAQSSLENAVEVQSGSSASFFPPTTLASLYVSQV